MFLFSANHILLKCSILWKLKKKKFLKGSVCNFKRSSMQRRFFKLFVFICGFSAKVTYAFLLIRSNGEIHRNRAMPSLHGRSLEIAYTTFKKLFLLESPQNWTLQQNMFLLNKETSLKHFTSAKFHWFLKFTYLTRTENVTK